jgi:hypothetical protein
MIKITREIPHKQIAESYDAVYQLDLPNQRLGEDQDFSNKALVIRLSLEWSDHEVHIMLDDREVDDLAAPIGAYTKAWEENEAAAR